MRRLMLPVLLMRSRRTWFVGVGAAVAGGFGPGVIGGGGVARWGRDRCIQESLQLGEGGGLGVLGAELFPGCLLESHHVGGPEKSDMPV